MSTILKEKKFDLVVSTLNAEISKAALVTISNLEFPTRRTENWRYVKLGKLLKQDLKTTNVADLDISDFLIPELDTHVVVLVNGHYNETLSSTTSSEGLLIDRLENQKDTDLFTSHFNTLSEKHSEEIFTSINTAYNQDGVFIHIDKNCSVEKPIYIIHINTSSNLITNTRNLIIADKGSKASIIQGYYTASEKGNFNNSLTEVFVKQNANLTIDKVQDINATDKHICTEEIHQEKDSNFKINTFMLNGELIRNNVNISVDGTNCHSEMNGLFLGTDNQFIDNHTRVDHLKSHCVSNELYKGILKDKSTGVFNGKVIVHQDAQVIEAYQQNNNVILSDTATMNTKPELEIFADDVKCSHGATTGQFDEEAIFYLQARGISKASAKEMLIGAFSEDVLSKIDSEKVRNFIESRI